MNDLRSFGFPYIYKCDCDGDGDCNVTLKVNRSGDFYTCGCRCHKEYTGMVIYADSYGVMDYD